MIVEKPSTKSMRMTAIDSEGHIKVFLVQARPDDITVLFKYLTERVNKMKAIDQDMERKSKELAIVEDSSDDEETRDEQRRSTTPTKYPAQTICIKINDHETGENECKKFTIRETKAVDSNSNSDENSP